LNIHYFFFFSLSEHIVFAMQTVPLDILIFGGIVIILAIDILIPSSSNIRRILGYIGFAFLLPAILAQIYQQTWATAVLVSLALMSLSLSTLNDRTLVFNLGYLFFGPLSVVLLIGLASGETQLSSHSDKSYIQIKNEGVYVGNLVRAGERGILFSVPAERRIYFRDWSKVVSVDSQLSP